MLQGLKSEIAIRNMKSTPVILDGGESKQGATLASLLALFSIAETIKSALLDTRKA